LLLVADMPPIFSQQPPNPQQPNTYTSWRSNGLRQTLPRRAAFSIQAIGTPETLPAGTAPQCTILCFLLLVCMSNVIVEPGCVHAEGLAAISLAPVTLPRRQRSAAIAMAAEPDARQRPGHHVDCT
jgi:hypothetical protein